ncbi:MAG: hypothetical protein ACK55Z_21835 [bacterium]
MSPICMVTLRSHMSPHSVSEIEQYESSIKVTYLRTFCYPFLKFTVSFSEISVTTPQISSVTS